MNKYFKITVLGAAAAATLLGSLDLAAARDRYPYWRDGHRGYYHGHRGYYHNGNWVAAGVLGGLAAGAIIGSALAEPEVVYERPPRRVIVQKGPVYAEPEYVAPEDAYPVRPRPRAQYVARGTIEPWTSEWRAYCSQRYQSFNARTGTYMGYDGQRHFCTGG